MITQTLTYFVLVIPALKLLDHLLDDRIVENTFGFSILITTIS